MSDTAEVYQLGACIDQLGTGPVTFALIDDVRMPLPETGALCRPEKAFRVEQELRGSDEGKKGLGRVGATANDHRQLRRMFIIRSTSST